MNRLDMRNQIWQLLGDNPTSPVIWVEADLNQAIALAVTAFSEVCPKRDRTIVSIQREVHKVDDTSNKVTSADATDQTSVNTLLNEIKADYNTHRASTTYHRAADTTNAVTSADATNLASSLTLANEIKADLNAHFIQSGVHMVDDTENLVSKENAVDLTTVKELANQHKEKYTEHLDEESDGRQVYVNAVVADSSFIRLEAVEYPVNVYPPVKPLFDYIAGNHLYLLTNTTPSTGDLVFIYWHKKHTFSDTVSTLPLEYENVVELGAEAFALLQRGTKKQHLAGTDLASARTEIAKIITGGVGELQDADDALNKVITYLESATAPSAKKYLDDGDAKIDAVNVGEVVADQYGRYAERSAEIARGFVDEAVQRIAVKGGYTVEVEKYIQAATQELEAAVGFREDGWGRLRLFQEKLERIKRETRAMERPQSWVIDIWESAPA